MKDVIRITFNALALVAAYAIVMGLMMTNLAAFQKYDVVYNDNVLLTGFKNALLVVWWILTLLFTVFAMAWPILLIGREKVNQKQ